MCKGRTGVKPSAGEELSSCTRKNLDKKESWTPGLGREMGRKCETNRVILPERSSAQSQKGERITAKDRQLQDHDKKDCMEPKQNNSGEEGG